MQYTIWNNVQSRRDDMSSLRDWTWTGTYHLLPTCHPYGIGRGREHIICYRHGIPTGPTGLDVCNPTRNPAKKIAKNHEKSRRSPKQAAKKSQKH